MLVLISRIINKELVKSFCKCVYVSMETLVILKRRFSRFFSLFIFKLFYLLRRTSEFFAEMLFLCT